jgi:hypothetical protein
LRIPLPFAPWINVLIAVVTLVVAVATAVAIAQRKIKPIIAAISGLGIAAVAILSLVLPVLAMDLGFALLDFLDKKGVGFYIARLVLGLLCLACMALVAVLLRGPVVDLLRLLRRRRRFASGSLTPQEWTRMLRESVPRIQAFLLKEVDERVLGITSAQYAEVLNSLTPIVNEEPASSVYWELRDKLEEAHRQSRHG